MDPTVDPTVNAALQAMRQRDWDTLRPLLHPYLHWVEGDTRLRGRTKVLAHLEASPAPAPPASWELRDGQIYRWVA
jgi:hypothetical protein